MPALIAYPNRTDAATLSGGSWLGSLPLTNLQSRIISKVARSVDLQFTSTKFNVVLDRARLVQVMALVNHNLSANASYRIRAYSDSFTTLVYDSGVTPVWPIVYAWPTLEWEQDNWFTGSYNEEDKIGYTLTMSVNLPAPIFCSTLAFELFDNTNPSAFVQVGRLFIAPAWTPTISMSMGASLGYETQTVVDTSLSGADYFDRRTPYRVAKFSLKWMTEDEGNVFALDMQRQLGIDQEVFFMWDVNDTIHRLRRSFVGRLRTLSQIEMPYVNVLSTPFEIKELI